MSRRFATALVALFSAITLGCVAVVALVVVRRQPDLAPALDPGTRFTAAAPIAVPANPADLEWGAGAMWLSSGDDGSISRIDPATGAITRFAVGGKPGQIVVTDDAVWVRNLSDRITKVDISTGRVSTPIPGGGAVSGMAVAGGSVWLSHRESGAVTRIDARTLDSVGPPIPVDREPTVMESDGTSVFVATIGDGALTRIDAATGEVRGRIDLGTSIGGIEVDRGIVYLAVDGGIAPVRTDTFTALPPITLQGWYYFEVADGVLWIVHDEARVIRRYALDTMQPIGEAVPGFGDDVGKARFGAGRLWLTRPADSAVVPLGPEDAPAIGAT